MPISKKIKMGLDLVLSLGVTWFICSPWVLSVGNKSVGLDGTAIVVGMVALCATYWAMFHPELLSPEVLAVLCGALMVMAPWGLGFARLPIASADTWIAGGVLVVGAAICLLLRASGGLGEASRVRWRHPTEVLID